MKIFEIGHLHFVPQFFPRWMKKVWQTDWRLSDEIVPIQINFFQKTIFQPLEGGTASLKFGRTKKCSKIGEIYDNFRGWPQISLERIEILTSGKRIIKHNYSRIEYKNSVNFGPPTPEIMRLTFTHPRSTVRVLHILMHLSAGQVTLLPGEFHPSP